MHWSTSCHMMYRQPMKCITHCPCFSCPKGYTKRTKASNHSLEVFFASTMSPQRNFSRQSSFAARGHVPSARRFSMANANSGAPSGSFTSASPLVSVKSSASLLPRKSSGTSTQRSPSSSLKSSSVSISGFLFILPMG